MAFQKPKKSPQFADLKGILAQTKEAENPLYQVVELIIERLTQLKLITSEEIEAAVNKNKPTGPQLALPHAPTHMPGGSDILPVTNAGVLLGRGSVSPGPIEHITLGTGVSMSGTTINVTGGVTPGPHGSTHAAAGTDKIPVSGNLRLLGRSTFGAGPMEEISVSSGLAMVGGNILVSNIPESAISDDAILARVAANEVISGIWTFTGSPVHLNHTTPIIQLTENDQAADNKIWRIAGVNGTFTLDLINDANTTSQAAFKFRRTGAVVSAIEFSTNNAIRASWDLAGNVTFNKGIYNVGKVDHSIPGSTGVFNPTGFGECFVVNVFVAVGCNIHGMVAKADGYTVVLWNHITSSGNLGIINMDGTVGGNRIACPNLATFSIPIGGSAMFVYDAANALWKVIARVI